ncbi:glucose/sorbosone dehydrogenase [bacterium]|nr:MAG: glucose/sorbosone dehydrogenase [bacterium]
MKTALIALLGLASAPVVAAPTLTPHPVRLQSGARFSLRLPARYSITPVVQGLKRPRFFALAPDGRLFLTQMYDKTDNSKGKVTILDGYDAKSHRFAKVTDYLTGLRNPNSVAFWHDAKSGKSWIYVALTDKLVRYPFKSGDVKPSGSAQVLTKFPAYGLSYKYGGWHLTRTVVVVPETGRVFVAVGSSGNAVIEKEAVRAAIVTMNADGSDQQIYVKGLRNAVGLRWTRGALWASNQGVDHLGDDAPNETFYKVQSGADYGWPYCYQSRGVVRVDPKFHRAAGAKGVPVAPIAFPAHSSALGFDWFDQSTSDSNLRNRWLFALHGSGFIRQKRGYSLVTATGGGQIEPFLTGFLQNRHIWGRPCDVWNRGDGSFWLTDDYAGVVYLVAPK